MKNMNSVMRMNADTPCADHEEQIQNNSRQIAELQTRADYKEDIIKELKTDMKEIKQDMKDIKEDINTFILKSVNDDSNIKEILNKQDNRITSLETTVKVLQWITTLLFGSGVIWILYSLLIK